MTAWGPRTLAPFPVPLMLPVHKWGSPMATAAGSRMPWFLNVSFLPNSTSDLRWLSVQHTHTDARTHAHTRTHMHIRMHTRIGTHRHTHMHAHTTHTHNREEQKPNIQAESKTRIKITLSILQSYLQYLNAGSSSELFESQAAGPGMLVTAEGLQAPSPSPLRLVFPSIACCIPPLVVR